MENLEKARKIAYWFKQAWEEQDTDKFVSNFAGNGVFHYKVFQENPCGRAELEEFWNRVVVGNQKDVSVKIHDYYIKGGKVVFEYSAYFYKINESKVVGVKGIAICELENNKVVDFKNYWQRSF